MDGLLVSYTVQEQTYRSSVVMTKHKLLLSSRPNTSPLDPNTSNLIMPSCTQQPEFPHSGAWASSLMQSANE